jgi:hydrogenase expression/formation protein HypC
MCLAVPGRILAIHSRPPAGSPPGVPAEVEDPLWRVAEVEFGGVRQQVSLACLAEAQVGDRVLVHVGLALAIVAGEDAAG